jgi:hypothetical protein
MASQFIQIPAPAGNGSGAAVDVSTFGATKTFVVSGSWVLTPQITIEFNNATVAANGGWQAIKTFQGAGSITVDVACKWVRVSITNFRGGAAPEVNVGGESDGTTLLSLPVPTGNGHGAAVDVSALGLFKTAQVALAFRGSLIVEISTDGGATWGQQFAFSMPGAGSAIFSADFMRVSRNGVPANSPGTPVVNIGACEIGGGGAGGIDLDNAGVPLAGGPFTLLNLVGATAVDDGGGEATITVTATPGNLQVFSYTVTGAEPDKDNIVIALPVARANANYKVFPSQGQFTNLMSMGVLTASRQVGQFTLSTTSDTAAGDIFNFIVIDAV